MPIPVLRATYMKHLLLLLWSLLLLALCPIHAQGTRPAASLASSRFTDRIAAYQRFLSGLDVRDAASIGQAAQEFERVFQGLPVAECDSAFTLFEQFYMLLERSLPLSQEAVDMSADRFKALDDAFREQGFCIRVDEGEAYVQMEPSGLYARLSPMLSAPMQAYLKQYVLEWSEQFSKDAVLLQPLPRIIDWIAWAEDFERTYPQFRRRPDVVRNRRYYQYVLAYGTDNTPSIQIPFRGESGFQPDPDPRTFKYAPQFRQAYDYLLSKYPRSEAAQLFTPYIQLLQGNRFREAMQMREQWMQKGLINME